MPCVKCDESFVCVWHAGGIFQPAVKRSVGVLSPLHITAGGPHHICHLRYDLSLF